MKQLRVDEVISEEYSDIQNAFIDEINILLESWNLTLNQELDELLFQRTKIFEALSWTLKYFQYAHYYLHHVGRNFLISVENFLEYLHVKRNFLRNNLEISQ